MGEVVHPAAGESIVEAEGHHKHKPPACHVADLSPVADRHIEKSSRDPEDGAGRDFPDVDMEHWAYREIMEAATEHDCTFNDARTLEYWNGEL